MKKNRGFTLIELLAVIAILGILISISSVAVNTLRKNQEEKNKKNIISSILTGAKEYNAEKRIPIDNTDNKNSVDVKTLIEGNHVDFDTNKYPDLEDLKVTKSQCTDNFLKIKYSVTVDDGTTYNDCGCERQVSSNDLSKELCTE